MSDVTLEKKLQLVRQVRSRYSENQYDLSNRERLLYGRTSLPERAAISPYAETRYDSHIVHSAGEGLSEPEDAGSSFKLRFFLAVLLFGLVIFMDKSHIAVGGINADQIYAAISADYEEKLEDWAAAVSNSVKH